MPALSRPACMFFPKDLVGLAPTGALPSFPGPVDGYATSVKATKCLKGPQPGAVLFRKFILEHLGGGDSGICRGCEGKPAKSEHNEGRAWDWKVNVNNPADVERVNLFFHWLFAPGPNGEPHANLRRAGIRYVIWDRRIWSAGSKEWRPYNGPSPHRDHVHITFSPSGAAAETSLYPHLGAPGPTPPVPPQPGPPVSPPPGSEAPLPFFVPLVLGVAIGYVASSLYSSSR